MVEVRISPRGILLAFVSQFGELRTFGMFTRAVADEDR